MDNSKSVPEHGSYVQTSWFSKIVDEQNKMQPTYGNKKEHDVVGGGLNGPHSNKQTGP